jgi:hypothetical protein
LEFASAYGSIVVIGKLFVWDASIPKNDELLNPDGIFPSMFIELLFPSEFNIWTLFKFV